MKSALEISIKGIKCDNTVCNYKDENVEYKDYKKWVNKPCPECGENLLTEVDYRNTKRLVRLTKFLNFILPKRKDNDIIETFSVNMDGTGKVEFEKKDNDTEL